MGSHEMHFSAYSSTRFQSIRLGECGHVVQLYPAGRIESQPAQKLTTVVYCHTYLHHREHGWKSARAGIPRAKAGVMRRMSMAILKANARHVLRGLEIIVPQAMHTHVARRARSEAAREAELRRAPRGRAWLRV